MRVQSPEERELDLKRHELAALEVDLVEQELRLSTLQAELAAFSAEYVRVVGNRQSALDDLKARIAEVQAARAPAGDPTQTAASKARATAESSAAEVGIQTSREPIPPFDPSNELKKLYREIARRVHPDLAQTDDDRACRHAWMTKVNDAYQRQDSKALTDLLSEWETSPESVSGTGVTSDLVRVIRQIAQVRRRIDSIQQEIDTLKNGKLYAFYEKCNVRREAGGNLLEEMAARLDKRIAAARRELADAQFNLGISHANGEGVRRDDTEAAHWFRLAADRGDAGAQYYLGFMYANGRGVPRDDGEAARWFRLFAAQDDHYARFLLDLLDSDILHVPHDDAELIRWLRLAAEQGNLEAQASLGWKCANGKGVPQDDAEAVRWFHLAAEQGDSPSQVYLSFMYSNGRGVPRDDAEAVGWFPADQRRLTVKLCPAACRRSGRAA